MPRYVIDRKTGELVEVVEAPRRAPVFPQVMRDIPEYKSPLGTGLIGSRSARREDLKRGNAREVDPGEYRPTYRNPTFATKRGIALATGDQ
jgi:hypothetical protein